MLPHRDRYTSRSASHKSICHNGCSVAEGIDISKEPSDSNAQAINGWPSNLATAFDGLSVLRLIGEASVATEFLAREVHPERLVALKILKADLAADDGTRRSFQHKALAASHIMHPNVAAIYRVGERSDGLPYVVEEYVGGITLGDLLRSNDLRSSDESTRIVVSLAKALVAANIAGIVHDDFTPMNVRIARDSGRVVVTNFGIGGMPASVLTQRRRGDVHAASTEARYASPEQTIGEPITSASNVFSLGAIARELFARQQAQESEPPRPDISEPLARLIEQCIKEHPSERPTADELIRHLSAYDQAVVPLNPVSPTQRAAESTLMRAAVIGGLVIMALGAALALWLFVHYNEKLKSDEVSDAPMSEDGSIPQEPATLY